MSREMAIDIRDQSERSGEHCRLIPHTCRAIPHTRGPRGMRSCFHQEFESWMVCLMQDSVPWQLGKVKHNRVIAIISKQRAGPNAVAGRDAQEAIRESLGHGSEKSIPYFIRRRCKHGAICYLGLSCLYHVIREKDIPRAANLLGTNDQKQSHPEPKGSTNILSWPRCIGRVMYH